MMYLAAAVSTTVLGKGLLAGLGFIGPAIGIGLIGNGYINAVGRNPEADKFFGKTLVFAALAEIFGLMAFALTFIVS